MKAITLRSFGGPDVFEFVDVATPKPGAGQVLVRVHATSINPLDFQVRRGDYPDLVPLPAEAREVPKDGVLDPEVVGNNRTVALADAVRLLGGDPSDEVNAVGTTFATCGSDYRCADFSVKQAAAGVLFEQPRRLRFAMGGSPGPGAP